MENSRKDRAGIRACVESAMSQNSVERINAYSLAVYMSERNVIIEDDDIFAGKICDVNVKGMIPEFLEEIDSLNKRYGRTDLIDYIIDAERTGLFCRNAGDHFTPAYDELIENGINAQINKYQEQCKKYAELVRTENNDDSKRKLDFFESELILQKAFQDRIIKYGQLAERKYELTKNDNFKMIAESCGRIAKDKPVHFFDAIQLLILAHETVVSEAGCGSISFGRIDVYLYPYYRADIDSGYITQDEAMSYLIALWRKIADFELSWQNVTIGGCDNTGKDCSNELTLMCMKATSIVRGDQPQLSLRITKDTSDYVWDAAIDLIKEGMGFPSLFNDDVAIKAKKSAVVSEEDARNYCVMGCVELCIPGKEYAHTEGARLNWAKVLELVLKGILDGHIKHEINTFEQFYNIYKSELIRHTKMVCGFLDIASENYAKNWPVPFASSLMCGTYDNARDVTDNGTVYNNLCINCVGFATTVDSLQAIKELVYERQEITIMELCKALYDADDSDGIINKKMLKCSKYGNDIDEVDYIAVDLSKEFCKTLSDYKLKYRTGKILPGFYISYFHADFGKYVGNTPDGRDDGTPLSASLSATAGKDTSGPLSLFNSANKIDMTSYGNGMALDVKFLPSFFDKKENREALKTTIKTYFDNGGLEVQFNVVDKDTLIKAQEHPELYGNLIVRVSGFSAHFIKLEKNLQDEIIRRTEHV
ncbi:MAG: pyruvate formate lyase family protein [Lachnospira sp.]